MAKVMLDMKSKPRTLGADVRALRKARSMTLVQLATALNRSIGWLSQVERDISTPILEDLQQIADVLDVSVSILLQSGAQDDEQGLIVRADARRPIGDRRPGLTETLLSPDLTDDFEVIHTNFAPHSELEAPLMRQTQELGYIVKGRFVLTVEDKPFKLAAGDSFRLHGQSYSWANPYDKLCEIIWVISPPVY